MKNAFLTLVAGTYLIFSGGCVSTSPENSTPDAAISGESAGTAGQSAVKDDKSQKNVVQVAIESKDHSTLVKAVQQAELVDALSNAGPFTVFAPLNAAFDQLPTGTLEDLMKEENKDKLADILQYHVFVGVLRADMIQDGQNLGQVNGGNVKVSKQGEDIILNGSAKVIATVPASNGIIYVIDKVLLPN
jgi:uncharacterized surface protein with fasciclin (FAS1) repeats